MALAPAASPESLYHPPIRIRSVLALALAGWALWSLVPRAIAGYRVHSLATTLADYAVCMVGPTGPSLLRDNPAEFGRLVHRRIVASAATERPFEKCAKQAFEITASTELLRKHARSAASFAEYGLSGSESQGFGISIEPLAATARAAWPFVRGYTALVKPSLGAYEAMHPVALPRPGVGSGIPGWRAPYRSIKKNPAGLWLAFGKGAHLSLHKSSDGGLSWRPASAAEPSADFAERCPAGDGRAYEVGLSADGDLIEVDSSEVDGTAHATELAPESSTVYAVACDERALVALVRARGSALSELFVCPFAERCAILPGPRPEVLPGLYQQNLDLARVHGTTVLAVTTKDIVRVSSSRDEGRTWTPFYVAFDLAEHPELQVDVRVPSRLLAIDGRLLLYGAANRSTQSYSVLVSDDHGASFRGL
jgi:hypothetical protein